MNESLTDLKTHPKTLSLTHTRKERADNYCCDLTRPCYMILSGVSVCARDGLWVIALSTNIKAPVPKRV